MEISWANLAIGLIVIENLEDCWSMEEVYKLCLSGADMPKDRFCIILSSFHLANNEDQLTKEDQAYGPMFIEKFTNNFRKAFLPAKNIAIDEATVAWRGLLKFRVYNPDKTGMKVLELCESAKGYCLSSHYTIP